MSGSGERCELTAICAARRWSIFWLLIVTSTVCIVGRISTLGVITSGNVTSPLMSANDRSRWAAIRALGDHGTYSIDDVIADESSGIPWDTIDKVQHPDRSGTPRFYSSKPPLLPTVYSWLYRAVRSATAWNLREHPLAVVRVMLLIVHAIPWVVYLTLLGYILQASPIRDWSRYYVMAVAGFGTYLSTFAVSVNNHLPAAFGVVVATYGLIRMINDRGDHWSDHTLAGLGASLAAANELPALILVVCAACFSLVRSPKRFATCFLPPALLVAGAFLTTNYLAHDDWRPPYAHRGDGRLLATVGGDLSAELDAGRLPTPIADVWQENFVAPEVQRAEWPCRDGRPTQRWIVRDLGHRRLSIVTDSASRQFRVHDWDNWYDYDGSYWLTSNEKKSVIDRGQPDRVLYLFHVLFGHHGIFSLTPVWLLALAGMVALVAEPRSRLQWFGAMTLLITVVVIGFYILLPACDRNYGGRTSVFRWALWLAPLWLVCMGPIVDWLGRGRWGRMVCLLLLLVSGLSAMYASDNPWIHPWLYQIWHWTGLPK